MISFEEFKKVELAIGKILSAERISGSEKLLKLLVDFGEEKRQIIAGIGKSYEPNYLVEKKLIFVINLEPRSLMGLESQGMVLAALDQAGQPIILTPEREGVNPGTRLS